MLATWTPVTQRMAFRVCGPNTADQLGGSQSSLIIGTNTALQVAGTSVAGTVGFTYEAWYRCSSPAFDYNSMFNLPAIPEGVFFSRRDSTNDTLINSEFSHTPTMLCGTGSRWQNNGVEAQSIRACSEPFNSTMGEWVHGAMTFNAATGEMIFYLNGVALTLSSTPGIIPLTNGVIAPAPSVLNVFSSITSTASSYLAAGTAVDNLRAWKVVRSASDIAQTWNRALEGGESNLLSYLQFFHNGTGSPLVLESCFGVWSDFVNTRVLTGGAVSLVDATTCGPTSFRSCSRGGCAPVGNVAAVFDVTSDTCATGASSTAVAAASSSTAAAASSGPVGGASSSTGSGGCVPGQTCAAQSIRSAGWGVLSVLAAVALKLAL